MSRFGKRNYLTAVLLLFMTLVSSACSEKITSPGDLQIDIAIRASIGAPGQAAQVSRYLLTVSGPGIMGPIVAELYMANGFLTGSIVVPAGPARLFHIDGLDRNGTAIYSGETVADVNTGSEFILDVDLYPRVPMIKVSPAYAETIQGDRLAMKIRVYRLPDIAQLYVELTNFRIQGESYLYYYNIAVNPYLGEVASVESWGGEGPEVYFQIALKDLESRMVDEEGYVEIATVYYQTGMYEVSPYETVFFTPSLTYMIDKQGTQLPVESVHVENSVVILHDYWSRLVTYWNLSLREITSQIRDGSGNNLDGIATGTTVIYGVEGDGRSFDGKDDYITVPDNDLLDLENEITMSMWVYLNSPDVMGTTPLSSLVCKGTDDGPINYQLLIEDVSTADGYATVYFRYGGSTYHTYRADIPNRLMDGWFHVVFSYRYGDPSSASFAAGYQCDNMELLNGAWVEGTGRERATVTQGNLYLGRDMTMERFYAGYLDEVIVSDKIWTLPVAWYYNICYR